MRRQLALRLHDDDLIVDSFAGGGGASLGIELALGRSPDIAINHDPEAIAMHSENHPQTRHFCESVWKVDPTEACAGRRVGLAWFSPDCTHFSKAKGGKPRSKKSRALAWIVVRWATAVRPRVIVCENVTEFQDWGPLDADGRPCPIRKGFTFRRWKARLEGLGYVVELRALRACDYGAPTTRKRLFVIARCDGQPIAWPEATHGPGLAPYRTAAECIDWTIPVPSVFERDRPLADASMRRIARGIQKFVFDAERPFVVPGAGGVPYLIHRSNGERPGQAPRIYDIQQPLGTIVAQGQKHAMCVAFLAKHFGGRGSPGSSLARPMDTITCRDHHALVRALIVKYYGTGGGLDLREPLHTITTRDRFQLVTVAGQRYSLADIGQRMLAPRELYRAQGFPDTYVIDSAGGRPITKTDQVEKVGNSVAPPIAAAIVRANVAREAQRRRTEAA